ncbi:hypothetical protein LZ318_22895 [Saccharopolyspora indica]|uniref:DddA-like double-stranded DNA deaminase toxin n=1 Tax=Saccharopolyspora indica TaxID=1229659 RepID=UPI0022EA3901|nr:DddA-like double-stranded DNA deaminase toxin [Saccharopolyspora indica]
MDDALEKLRAGQDKVVQAQDCMDEAGQPAGLGVLLGSVDDAAQSALADADQVANDLVRIHQVLDRICELVIQWRRAISGAPDCPRPIPRDRALESEAVPEKLPYEERMRKADEIADRMQWDNTGGQIRGEWLDAQGTSAPVASGQFLKDGRRDRWAVAAETRAKRLGISRPPGRAAISDHVEIKFAEFMRAHPQYEDEVIVLPKAPCGASGRPPGATCHAMLPYWLPKGARLTVVDPDGVRYSYTGKGGPDDDS